MGTGLIADVPPARIHQPDVPFFLESMDFRTQQMQIFPEHAAGMVIDSYSDLIWNPAFILRQPKKSVYLDFGTENNFSLPTKNGFSRYSEYYNYNYTGLVLPSWYNNTSLAAVTQSPLYRFAAILPVSSKITLGFTNRAVVDYGPFRSAGGYWDDIYNAYLEYANVDVRRQRIEVDENQRSVLGIQSEITLGYKLSKKIDLGLRLGYYNYSSDASLYDSKEGKYPHHSFDNLDDEADDISGHHLEAGIGTIFHLGEKTRLGIYGGITTGKSSEEIVALDNSGYWSEKAVKPDYYSLYSNSLEMHEDYSGDGKRPKFTITFERDISKKMVFRSFFSYSYSSIDITGSTASTRMSSGDWTYDHYHNHAFYFRRHESESTKTRELSGSGNKKTTSWKWFASLVYKPNKHWGIFSGIQVQGYTFEQESDESSAYSYDGQNKYTLFQPGTNKYHDSYSMNYSLQGNFKRMSLFIPVGLKIKAVKNLYVIVGSDLTLSLTDQSLAGWLRYPVKVSQVWENGKLIVDDKEVDRLEEYRSDPAKKFSRTLAQRFGIVYAHPSGLQVYLGSYGDILHTSNWSFGFEMNW